MTDLDASLREAPVQDKGGYPYLIHPLTDGVPRCDPALLRQWVEWAAPLTEGATLLVAPEAMALPLAAALSLETGIPYVCVRKRPYELPGEELAYAETGYSSSQLYINDIASDDKVVVVDDVLSTGGTLTAILGVLARKCQVLASVVFLEKGDPSERVEAATRTRVHVMRRVLVDGSGVTLEP